MLWIVGLPPNASDVPPRAMNIIKNAGKIYFECYTNFYGEKYVNNLRKLINKEIIIAKREIIENEMEKILEEAREKDVVILTLGNPLFATTHFYYFIEGRRKGIEVRFVHSPSVFDLALETGLHAYKFGKIASISFHYSEYPYNVLKENISIGAHTLFLLDLDPINKKFMTIREAIERLLEIEEKRRENLMSEKTLLVGCARLGTESRKIVYARAKDLMKIDFGDPPYCLIYPGELHFTEEEALELWKYESDS